MRQGDEAEVKRGKVTSPSETRQGGVREAEAMSDGDEERTRRDGATGRKLVWAGETAATGRARAGRREDDGPSVHGGDRTCRACAARSGLACHDVSCVCWWLLGASVSSATVIYVYVHVLELRGKLQMGMKGGGEARLVACVRRCTTLATGMFLGAPRGPQARR